MDRLYRLISGVLAFIVISFLLTSCQAFPMETSRATQTPTQSTEPTQPPTDTPTLAPTVTNTPTDTPPPTDTPLPPTPTPNASATAEVLATQTAETVLSEIQKELERVGVPAGEGHLGWLMTEPVSIKANQHNMTSYSEIEPRLKAADFVIHTNITWESTGGFILCGIMMRAEPNFEKGEHYRFQTIRLSGLPSWDIERWNYNQWQATASNIIVDSRDLDQSNGATNRFTIVARGPVFTVFINDDKPKNVVESKLKEGYFAFMTWQDTGITTCTFSDAWIWVLK